MDFFRCEFLFLRSGLKVREVAPYCTTSICNIYPSGLIFDGGGHINQILWYAHAKIFKGIKMYKHCQFLIFSLRKDTINSYFCHCNTLLYTATLNNGCSLIQLKK